MIIKIGFGQIEIKSISGHHHDIINDHQLEKLWKHFTTTLLFHSFHQPIYMDMKRQINMCLCNSIQTLTLLNLNEKNIVFNSIESKFNGFWIAFNIFEFHLRIWIQFKLHYTNSFNIFFQMKLNFQKLNSFFSSFHCC
jgi:hypothetical protein